MDIMQQFLHTAKQDLERHLQWKDMSTNRQLKSIIQIKELEK